MRNAPMNKAMFLCTSRDAVRDFSGLVSAVAFGGQRAMITRSGRPVAVLIAPGDLAQLERGATHPLPRSTGPGDARATLADSTSRPCATQAAGIDGPPHPQDT